MFLSDSSPPRFPVKELLAKARSAVYRGKNRECPCCGRTFKLFMYSPFMAARCPGCLSIERYRLLCKYLAEGTDFGSRKIKLLDVAPAWCFQEFCRSYPNVHYLSIDIASPLAMRKMDLTALEFDDDSFDCIICYHVLEHIDDDAKAMEEILRVLKPDGWAVIQVPIHVQETVQRHELSEEEADEILKFPDHRRAYGKDFKDLLEQAGFKVEVVDFVKKFSRPDIERYGLDTTEDLYICRK